MAIMDTTNKNTNADTEAVAVQKAEMTEPEGEGENILFGAEVISIPLSKKIGATATVQVWENEDGFFGADWKTTRPELDAGQLPLDAKGSVTEQTKFNAAVCEAVRHMVDEWEAVYDIHEDGDAMSVYTSLHAFLANFTRTELQAESEEVTDGLPSVDNPASPDELADAMTKHINHVEAKQAEVDECQSDWDACKSATTTAKKRWECSVVELGNCIKQGVESHPLFDRHATNSPPDADRADGSDPCQDEREPDATLEEIGFSESLIGKLSIKGVSTLWKLCDWFESGNLLTYLPGIGGNKAADALQALDDFREGRRQQAIADMEIEGGAASETERKDGDE